MNRKTTYLLFGVLVLLVSLWWGQRRWQARKTAEYFAKKPLVENFQPEAVDRIEILRNHDRGELQAFRRDGAWMLGDNPSLPADPVAVDRLFVALRRAEIKRVAALRRENLDQFGLEEINRTTVRLRQGEATRYEFGLGVSSEDFLSTYVTRLDDPKVYFIEGFTREDIAPDWRDLAVLHFEPTDATQIAYAQKRGFTLTKGNNQEWTLDGQPTKTDAVKELVRELSNLRAEDVTATHATFTPSGLTIEINTPSGTQALIIGQSHSDGGVFVKNTAGYFYTLTKKTKEEILPTRRALLR